MQNSFGSGWEWDLKSPVRTSSIQLWLQQARPSGLFPPQTITFDFLVVPSLEKTKKHHNKHFIIMKTHHGKHNIFCTFFFFDNFSQKELYIPVCLFFQYCYDVVLCDV